MLRNFTLTDITWSKVNNHLYESNIYLDLYKVFDGDIHDIDIKTDRTSHTNPDQIQLTEFGQDLYVMSCLDRKSTRLNSSHVRISYAVFCLKKKKITLLLSTTSTSPR